MTAADYLSRLAVALPLVVGLLLAGWYGVRRGWIRHPVPGANPLLRAVATLGLGPGARLVVVDNDGRRLLIAVSRTGVTLIDARP